MYDIYLKKIGIEKLRHLEKVEIPISDNTKKHLIVTGKNGSGKTSLLQAVARQFIFMTFSGKASSEERIMEYGILIEKLSYKLNLEFSVPSDEIKVHFVQGDFVLAYYQAERKFNAEIPKHVEKVSLKENYMIYESPRSEFVK